MKGYGITGLRVLSCILFLSSAIACTTVGTGAYFADEPGPRNGPPPHAPAHGYRAKYTYHYYPQAEVYFDISRKLYFYMEADEWKVSASLPGGLRAHLGDHVTIETDYDKPYMRSKESKESKESKGKWPPGQAKKKVR
jgi:hypothetical protein